MAVARYIYFFYFFFLLHIEVHHFTCPKLSSYANFILIYFCTFTFSDTFLFPFIPCQEKLYHLKGEVFHFLLSPRKVDLEVTCRNWVAGYKWMRHATLFIPNNLRIIQNLFEQKCTFSVFIFSPRNATEDSKEEPLYFGVGKILFKQGKAKKKKKIVKIERVEK